MVNRWWIGKMKLKILDFDDIDKNEIKFGFWMALHHPFEYRGKFAYGQIKYSLGIIKRNLLVIE